MAVTIYGLFDPREPDAIRYVGFSSNPSKRLWAHINEAKSSDQHTHKLSWMRRLLSEGVRPELKTLDICASLDAAGVREIQLIAELRAAGHRLTNGTDGGDGTALWTEKMRRSRGEISAAYWEDEEQRQRQKQAMQAFYATPEGQAERERRRLIGAEAAKRRVYSPEQYESQRIARLGKPHPLKRTPEWNAKISAAQKGRPRPQSDELKATRAAAMKRPETREKMRQAALARWARKGQHGNPQSETNER